MSQQHQLNPEQDTIYRELDFEVCKSVDGQTRTISVIASTAALDAHGEIVEQNWDLNRYLKNPVVLWNHNRSNSGNAADLLPIGRSSNVQVKAKKLIADITFASEKANPLAEQCWLLANEGILKGVSVGFRPGQVTTKIENGKEIYVLSKCELREISMVPIGSNPETVSKSIDEEHKSLAIFTAAKDAQAAKGEDMTIKEKSIEQFAAELSVSEKALGDATDKIKSLEGDIAAEKKLSAKLEEELKLSRADNQKSVEAISKSELDKRMGTKFAPAEREELDSLAKEIGTERICKLLDVRPDLKILQEVEVEGKKATEQSPSEKSLAGGASAQIASEASVRATA